MFINGSTGIEVSMLLRRLKAKIGQEDIRYILTGATLCGENDNIAVAEFGSNLFAGSFAAEDIIRAQRIQLKAPAECHRLPVGFYKEVAGLIHEGIPEQEIIAKISQQVNCNKLDSLEQILYNLMQYDVNYWEIRSYLQNSMTVAALANKIKWNQSEIENFVTVASKCEKNGDKLFDARYHMFLRAWLELSCERISPGIRKMFLFYRKNNKIKKGR
jgi:hypothetical protein